MYQFFAKQMLLKCVVLSAFILGDLANVAVPHDGSVRIGASASYAQDSGDAGAAAGETGEHFQDGVGKWIEFYNRKRPHAAPR